MTPAWRTGADRASGGVAVCARRAYGLTPHDRAVDEACAHRVAAAWLGGVCRGGVHLVSVYFRHTEGLSDANLHIMREVATFLRTIRGPWVLWLLTSTCRPKSFGRLAGWMSSGASFSRHRCRRAMTARTTTFVVSASLAHAVVAVQRIEDAGLSPHFPVRLDSQGGCEAARGPQAGQASTGSTAPLPFGPQPAPPSYGAIPARYRHAGGLLDERDRRLDGPCARRSSPRLVGATIPHFIPQVSLGAGGWHLRGSRCRVPPGSLSALRVLGSQDRRGCQRPRARYGASLGWAGRQSAGHCAAPCQGAWRAAMSLRPPTRRTDAVELSQCGAGF